MAEHINALEKEMLIRRYRSNPNVKLSDFCEVNNISDSAFRNWIKQYDSAGIEGLYRVSKTSAPILPEGINRTEENYKRRVIELTIENERLKKNYIAMTVDGHLEYKALKKKNTK